MRPSTLEAGNRLDELAALLLLTRKQLIPVDRMAAAVDQYGSAVELLSRSHSAQASLPGFEMEVSEVSESRLEVQSWLDRGIDVRSVVDDSYPFLLHEIFNRPSFLFLRGRRFEKIDSWAIAVVGTRQPSKAGIELAAEVTRSLGRAGFPIVSGLALGIDTIAHETALDNSVRTFAVLGSGLNFVYPASNADLARRILEAGGALVSHFLPEQPPTRWTFPLRNVVMSGLSMATVVVEAGETSGARIQAEKALEHGRTVFLPRSLVTAHAWAAKFATEGKFGCYPIIFDSPDEILDSLVDRPTSLQAVNQ
jgi:DNA processing protein